MIHPTLVGLFVKETLSVLQKWKTDRSAFLEESAALRASMRGSIDYAQYRRIVVSWETYMTNVQRDVPSFSLAHTVNEEVRV
jgi:hypothetical protein